MQDISIKNLQQQLEEYITSTIWPHLEGIFETVEDNKKLVASTGKSGNLLENNIVDFPSFKGRDTIAQRQGPDASYEGWKNTISYVIRTIQSFDLNHPFYGGMSHNKSVENNIRTINKNIVYKAVQTLNTKIVIKRIEETKGRYSLFQQLFDHSVWALDMLWNGEASIDVNGQTLKSKKDVISFIGSSKSPEKGMPLYLKTAIAEGLGALFMQKTFGLGAPTVDELVKSRTLIEHPFGINNFPDFMIDFQRANPTLREKLFSVIPVDVDTQVLFVDTKSTILSPTGAKRGGNSYRLGYPPASVYNSVASNFGQESYIAKGEIPDRSISFEEFEAIKNVCVTTKGDIEYKGEDAIKQGKFIQNTLKKQTAIMYQDVGADAGYGADYSVVSYPTEPFVLKKMNENRYQVYTQEGKNIADFIFYMGDARKTLSDLLINDPNHPIKEYEHLIQKAVVMGDIESSPDDSKEKGPTITSLIQKYIPLSDWNYMFVWKKDAFINIDLNTLKPKKKEEPTLPLTEKVHIRKIAEAIVKRFGPPEGFSRPLWGKVQFDAFNKLYDEGIIDTTWEQSLSKNDGMFQKFASLWAEIGHKVRESFTDGELDAQEMTTIISLTYEGVKRLLPSYYLKQINSSQ